MILPYTTFAKNSYDPTLDRSYEYDQVGRLTISHSGAEARAHVGLGQWGTMDGPYSQGYDYDAWGNITHKYGWGGEVQGGTAGQSSDIYYAYTSNQRNGFSYDAAGNLTNDLGQTFTYDATGQQATASYSGYSLQQSYDGDGRRVKKNDNGTVTYYVRSSVLGGQVTAEINVGGTVARTYTYLGAQLLSLRNTNEKGSGAYWIHEDPITKSKRVTNSLGTVVSTVEMDPWGVDTTRSLNAAFQPRKFTSYERDGNGSDEAMFRRYNRWQSRFDQPDPYDGSYSLSNPQSFNRYAYVQGDPVNFVDPSGLNILPTSLFNDWYISGWRNGWSQIYGLNPISFTFETAHGWVNDVYWTEYRTFWLAFGPQNPGRDEKEINDCKTLADMTQTIADSSANQRVFLDTVARTFTAARFAGYREMIDTQNRASRMTFGDSGFKSDFRDGANQVRHFVAGFIAGALDPTGGLRALSRMNDRENPRRNPIDQKDVNLNRVSTQFGATYGGGGGGGMEFTRRYLARAIRKVLCE